jgi:diguanylate cyclase
MQLNLALKHEACHTCPWAIDGQASTDRPGADDASMHRRHGQLQSLGTVVDYTENIERSTELLRQALPLMSRQAAALHPVSYAVWYDYVAQRNPGLRAAVDQHLARQGQLDEASTRELFRRHVAEIDPVVAQQVADGFQQVLTGMAHSARQAGDQTARFGSSLSRLSEALASEPDSSPEAVAEALADTQQMQQAMGRLQAELVASQREIERLRSEVRRARHEATVDALTGLANRRAFDQRLATCLTEQIVADRHQPTAWLLMGDIDHFKQINDTWGHGFGDQVIRAVAGLLKDSAPADALAARVGGEEFALLLPRAELAEAQALADRIRQRISAARIRRQGSEETLARVTLSLGLTPHRPGEAPNDFVDRADRALYASKQAGRDRVTVLPAH